MSLSPAAVGFGPVPTDAAAPVQLELATRARVRRGAGEPLPLAPRDAALLAWLAIEGPTPRARLATLLWPEHDADAARNSLRQRLFQLRRQVGCELVAGSTTLSLADGLHHDLADADVVLAELDAATFGSGEFAAWLTQQRKRRRDRLREALAELSAMAERARDWRDALGHAEELLALDPLSEEAHRRVMRLHYLAGDRAAALLAFDHCERMLKHEVGTAPSEPTLALLRTIEASALPAPLHAAGVPPAVLRPPRLVGRDAERAALHAAWDAGEAAVICGDGGLGKSRLVGDVAAERGGVLITSARPGDAQVVYASASRLLRQLPLARLAALPTPLRQALGRLLPELADGDAGGTAPLRGERDRTRFFNAVAAALATPALGIAGCIVDDLHFADDASAELLQYLAGAVPCRWAVTARRAELGRAGRAWLDALQALPGTAAIELQPLTLAQVAELVDSLGVPGLHGGAAAPALLRHTGGNPLYVLETIKAWLQAAQPAAGAVDSDGSVAAARGAGAAGHGRADSTAHGRAGPAGVGRGPAAWPLATRLPAAGSVSSLIGRRIGQLSPAAVELARCAAIASPDFSIGLASAVLGRRTLELADPWAELEAAQVFRDGAFAHDLIYEAALASVPQPVARQLHAEVAAYLAQHGGAPATLAAHWDRAGEWARAAQAYAEAAQRSADAGRAVEQSQLLAEAARCFHAAGDAGARFGALLQRSAVLATNDVGNQAQAALAELEGAAGDERQRLQALGVRLELAITRFEIDAALDIAPQAVQAARAIGDRALELRFAIAWSGALGDARRMAEGVQVLEPYLAWIDELPDLEQRWSYWEARSLALDYAGRLRDAAQGWATCQALARAAGRPDMLWRSLSNAAAGQAKLGQVAAACEMSAQARRIALDSGEVGRIRLLQMQAPHAHRLRDTGRYAEALPLLEEALAGFQQEGSATDVTMTAQRLALLFIFLGQPARAQQALAQARPGVPPGVAMFQRVLEAELLHLRGSAEAEPAIRAALALVPNPDDVFHRIATLFATRIVPAEEGEAMAAGLAVWAAVQERFGLAMSAHVRAAGCAAAQGAWTRALPHVEAALALSARHQPESFYLGELWWVAARVHAALGRGAEAARLLDDGRRWVMALHDGHVPEPFRPGFLQHNAVNRALLALVPAALPAGG
jgi:DNA-binding SARP family transcriptional activator